MLTGHASHQVGLDADIWLTPMPDRRLSEREREDLSATSMLAADQVSVDPSVWTDSHVRLLKRAASYTGVERIFVHPAIKKALCEAAAKDTEPAWTRKIRAYWGHHYHFHVRIACPEGSSNCEAQPALPADDGCGAELKRWLALVKPKPQPTAPTTPAKPQTGEARAHARPAARRLPLGAVERHRCRGGGRHAPGAGQGATYNRKSVRDEIGSVTAGRARAWAVHWAGPRSAAPTW